MSSKYGEPWKVEAPSPDASVTKDANRNAIMDDDPRGMLVPDYEEQCRIVACINAMRGIKDPAAFVNGHKRTLVWLKLHPEVSGGDIKNAEQNAAFLESRLAEKDKAIAGLVKALKWVKLKSETYSDGAASWQGALIRCGEIAYDALAAHEAKGEKLYERKKAL